MLTQPLVIQARFGWEPDPQFRGLVPAGERFRFVVRTLNRRELRDWSLRYPGWQQPGHPDSLAFEDALVTHCVLEAPPEFHGEPWDWDRVYAGLASQLAVRILELSGHGSQVDPGISERVLAYLQGPMARTDLLVVTAFDGVTPRELFEMDPEEYEISVALAYAKLQALNLNPEGILHPEQKSRKGRAPLPGMGGEGPPAPPAVQGLPGSGGRRGDPRVQSQVVTEAAGAWGSMAPDGASYFYRNPNV